MCCAGTSHCRWFGQRARIIFARTTQTSVGGCTIRSITMLHPSHRIPRFYFKASHSFCPVFTAQVTCAAEAPVGSTHGVYSCHAQAVLKSVL